MTEHYSIFRVAIISLYLGSTLLFSSITRAANIEVIQVEFANSCDASVGATFNHAVTMLHSFEYPESGRLFREILNQDPGCAMARWGIAMSLWHPLWAPPSVDVLKQGAEILQGTETAKVTARESGFLSALRSFYSSTDPSTHVQRASAFEQGMRSLYIENLDDPEPALFYALSLLATANPHDKSYAHQYKAAGILNWVRSSQPAHPGVLHYIIHSYDYPGLTHLALDAALIYADVAPDSAHAQHMPSHIFTRLGLWDRSMSSNHDSTASAAAYTKRANLSGHYDEGLHSIDYLMYAMLQTAHDDEALDLLHRLANIGKTNHDNFKVAYTYAAAPARYALERRQWKEASEIRLGPAAFPWHEFAWARSINHFARGIGAARSGQIDAARDELAAIQKIQSELGETILPYWREEVSVHEKAVSAWILYAEGDQEKALSLASAAADQEDAVDKHPVTPGEVLPARELFADLLLELGMREDALTQYQVVLESAPNRYNAVLGAARSAAAADQQDAAAHYYRMLLTFAAAGRPARESLHEALKFVAQH